MSSKSDKKYRKLFLSIVLDGLGMLTSSWLLPIIGDFGDVVWAPLSAYIMIRMYKGSQGQIAGAVTFIEEAIPGMDFIPTFTLMWLYTYVFRGKKAQEIIDV